MPITSVSARTRIPVLGKIRLGVRKVTSKGSQFPTNVEHFVLTDAPGVEEVYGADPKELEIMFMTDDLEQAIPTWLKWYSAGKTDSKGKAIGGDLNCIGPGPDENGNPGEAKYYMARDPKTGRVPTRPCLGQMCPDWRDSKGSPKCKQSMQVICILPRVGLHGCYIIETSSWRSIHAFTDQLTHLKAINGGAIKGVPWKIYRKEEAVAHTDQAGARSVRNHHIMKIDVMLDFRELHGKEFAARIDSIKNISLAPNVSHENLLTAPAEDFYPVADNDEDYRRLTIERGENPVIDVATPKQSIDEVAADPEVMELFDVYAKALGKSITPKTRMIAIRQKESSPNIKEAVIETLHMRIKEAKDMKEMDAAKVAKTKALEEERVKMRETAIKEGESAHEAARHDNEVIAPLEAALTGKAPVFEGESSEGMF